MSSSLPTAGSLVSSYVSSHPQNAKVLALGAYATTKPAYVVGYHAAYTSVLEDAVTASVSSFTATTVGPFVFGGSLNLKAPNDITADTGYLEGGSSNYRIETAEDWPTSDLEAKDVGRYYIISISGSTASFSVILDNSDTSPVIVKDGDSVAIKMSSTQTPFKTLQKVGNSVTNIRSANSDYVAVVRTPETNNYSIDIAQTTKTTINSALTNVEAGTGLSVSGTGRSRTVALSEATQSTLSAALTGVTAGTGISVSGSGSSKTVAVASGLTDAINDTLTSIIGRLQNVTDFMAFMQSTGTLVDSSGAPLTFAQNMQMATFPYAKAGLISNYGSNGIVGFPIDQYDLHLLPGSPGSASVTSQSGTNPITIVLQYNALTSPPSDADKATFYWRILNSSGEPIDFGPDEIVSSSNQETSDSYVDGHEFYSSGSPSTYVSNLTLTALAFTTAGEYYVELYKKIPVGSRLRGALSGGLQTSTIFIKKITVSAPSGGGGDTGGDGGGGPGPAEPVITKTLSFVDWTAYSDDMSGAVVTGNVSYSVDNQIVLINSGTLTIGTSDYAVTVTEDGNFTLDVIPTIPLGSNQNGTYNVTFRTTIEGTTVSFTDITSGPSSLSALVNATLTNFSLTNDTNSIKSIKIVSGTVHSGTIAPNEEYDVIPTGSEQSEGSGLTIKVKLTSGQPNYSIEVIATGSGYIEGEILTVSGTLLGGDSDNDLTLRVNEGAFIGDELTLSFMSPESSIFTKVYYALEPHSSPTDLIWVGPTTIGVGNTNDVNIINKYGAAGSGGVGIYLKLSNDDGSVVREIRDSSNVIGFVGYKIFKSYDVLIPVALNINTQESETGGIAIIDANGAVNLGDSFTFSYADQTLTMTDNWPTQIGHYDGTSYSVFSTNNSSATSITGRFFNNNVNEAPVTFSGPVGANTTYSLWVSGDNSGFSPFGPTNVYVSETVRVTAPAT